MSVSRDVIFRFSNAKIEQRSRCALQLYPYIPIPESSVHNYLYKAQIVENPYKRTFANTFLVIKSTFIVLN